MVLEINQRINHPIFGEGSIFKIEERFSPYGTPEDAIVTVKFDHPMITEAESKLLIRDKGPKEYRIFTETTIQPYLV